MHGKPREQSRCRTVWAMYQFPARLRMCWTARTWWLTSRMLKARHRCLRTAAPHGVNIVIGSTGITDAIYEEAESLANEHEVGVIIAPNFAMGAVLMIALAKQASRFFDYADLTEMHHEAKIDSPSGTALAIANAALEGKPEGFVAPVSEKELIDGARGATHQGISVHSARMPGRVAHHELVFGALGQTLTIRHDSVNRESFMPGVTLAINEVINRKGLTVGLDKIMGL